MQKGFLQAGFKTLVLELPPLMLTCEIVNGFLLSNLCIYICVNSIHFKMRNKVMFIHETTKEISQRNNTVHYNY